MSTASAGIGLQIEGPVATVTIDRPQVLNAINGAAEAALQAIWTELEQSQSVRVIVLTGAGDRAFCAGADMKTPSPTPPRLSRLILQRPNRR